MALSSRKGWWTGCQNRCRCTVLVDRIPLNAMYQSRGRSTVTLGLKGASIFHALPHTSHTFTHTIHYSHYSANAIPPCFSLQTHDANTFSPSRFSSSSPHLHTIPKTRTCSPTFRFPFWQNTCPSS